MQIIPYLTFNGNCEEAFKFYEKCLSGKITAMMAHKGTPAEEHTPPGWLDKIMHARLAVNGGELMGSDAPPDHYRKPQGISVSLQFKDTAEAERVYKALSDQGTIHMPFQKTFWTAGFAMFVDRYDIAWMINCE